MEILSKFWKNPMPEKRKIRCGNCGARLTVELKDTRPDRRYPGGIPGRSAYCPICSNYFWYCDGLSEEEARK